MNSINNDNVHQGLKIVFGDNNINLFLCMVGEKVWNILYMSSTFQHDSYNDISKCIMGYNVLTLAWAM